MEASDGKTQAEIRDKLTKALSDRIDGIVYDDENMTVGEYLNVWLKGSVYGSVRRSTYDRDTNLVNNHVKPILGGLKLRKLNSAHVQNFYRDRLDAGLSASTVRKMHDILRRGLAQAVERHLVPRNVADPVKPPRPVPKEMCALSAAKTRRLLEAAGGERRRERKTHSDQERRESNLRRAIRLTPQAVGALRLHPEHQLRDMEILGDRYQDQGLVFATDTGAPINPSNLRQRIRP